MPWISAFSSKIVGHQWHPTASRKGQETLLLHRWFRCPGASDNQWWTNGESMANQWWLVHNGEYLWNIYGISMEYLWNIYDTSIEYYDFHVANTMNQLHQKDYSLSIGWWSPQKDPAMTKQRCRESLAGQLLPHIWVRWHHSCSPGRLLGSLPIWMARWYRLCLVFYIGFYIGLFPFMAIFHIHHLRYFPARHLHLVWECLGRLSMVPTPTPASWLCPATHLRLGSIHFRSQMGL